MRRVEQASGRESLEGEEDGGIDLGIEASRGGSRARDVDPPIPAARSRSTGCDTASSP
jgi:hypothetical protein